MQRSTQKRENNQPKGHEPQFRTGNKLPHHTQYAFSFLSQKTHEKAKVTFPMVGGSETTTHPDSKTRRRQGGRVGKGHVKKEPSRKKRGGGKKMVSTQGQVLRSQRGDSLGARSQQPKNGGGAGVFGLYFVTGLERSAALRRCGRATERKKCSRRGLGRSEARKVHICWARKNTKKGTGHSSSPGGHNAAKHKKKTISQKKKIKGEREKGGRPQENRKRKFTKHGKETGGSNKQQTAGEQRRKRERG